MAADSSPIPDFAVSVTGREGDARPRFSICTLVTSSSEYAGMVESFVSHGFTSADCEFLYIDNRESNQFDAFGGYNVFLSEARGDFIVLCHQDILLLDDGRAELEQRLGELTARDSRWAVCGNAGGVSFTRVAVRITDRYGQDQSFGSFPSRARALDENFIVVRRDANLALSQDLSGFHFYGADLCIIADFLGCSAWVIDFHLQHNGVGTTGTTFYALRNDIARKYRRAFRPRWVVTTVSYFFVSGSPTISRLLTSHRAGIPVAIRFLVDFSRGLRIVARQKIAALGK